MRRRNAPWERAEGRGKREKTDGLKGKTDKGLEESVVRGEANGGVEVKEESGEEGCLTVHHGGNQLQDV